MTYSLRQARANKMNVDIENAFTALNELHRFICSNDISFRYPTLNATEEINKFFP